MTNLINKILAIFQLKLVSTKPVSLVEESVKFLNTLPESYLCDDIFFPPYVGDVVFVKDEVAKKSYFRQQVLGMDDKYYDYGGDTYTLEEIQEKLTN
jgi:hypothetical protein